MPDYGHDLRLGTFITAGRAPARLRPQLLASRTHI
jgi:hypothetical protein